MSESLKWENDKFESKFVLPEEKEEIEEELNRFKDDISEVINEIWDSKKNIYSFTEDTYKKLYSKISLIDVSSWDPRIVKTTLSTIKEVKKELMSELGNFKQSIDEKERVDKTFDTINKKQQTLENKLK